MKTPSLLHCYHLVQKPLATQWMRTTLGYEIVGCGDREGQRSMKGLARLLVKKIDYESCKMNRSCIRLSRIRGDGLNG